MLRDMTIGQFYPAESVIHRLDPRVKVVGVLAYLISLYDKSCQECGSCTGDSPCSLCPDDDGI